MPLEELTRVSERFQKLLDQETIDKRTKYLYDLFDLYKQEYKWPSHCVINEAILSATVRKYFYEIERMKIFHGINRIEQHKIAAYTMKWINSYKPISFSFDSKNDAKKNIKGLLCANELYAAGVGLSIAEVEPSRVGSHLLHSIVYTLKYRRINEESLVLWFEALGACNDELYEGADSEEVSDLLENIVSERRNYLEKETS